MKDHKWIAADKPCTHFICKACKKTLPNTVEGRAKANKTGFCLGATEEELDEIDNKRQMLAFKANSQLARYLSSLNEDKKGLPIRRRIA
jgi:hypothetical protein